MGKYIESKKLYDPHNKRIIHCKNDLLGEVFQLDEFVVGDFRYVHFIHVTVFLAKVFSAFLNDRRSEVDFWINVTKFRLLFV